MDLARGELQFQNLPRSPHPRLINHCQVSLLLPSYNDPRNAELRFLTHLISLVAERSHPMPQKTGQLSSLYGLTTGEG